MYFIIILKKWSESCSVMSDSLQPRGLYSPWTSPGQNTGVGSLSLLQGIFPTQGSNPSLQHCRQILYQLSHRGSPPSPYRCQIVGDVSQDPQRTDSTFLRLHFFCRILELPSFPGSDSPRLYSLENLIVIWRVLLIPAMPDINYSKNGSTWVPGSVTIRK